MRLTYSKELYSRTALVKAAFHFTDRAYVHLDCDGSNYVVDIVQKPDTTPVDLQEFDNTILAQITREEIYQKTKDIRKIALARAMASSMVETKEKIAVARQDDKKPLEPFPFEQITEQPENILKDWFTT